MAMMRTAHLFFDLGDTLVDLRGLVPAMVGELQESFPALGSAAGPVAMAWARGTADATPKAQGDAYRPGVAIAGEALSRPLRDAGISLDSDAAQALVRSAWRSYLRQPRLYDDVSVALLSELRSMVDGMGLVTDSDEDMVRPLLQTLHLEPVFDVVVVSDSVRTYKPDPRIYQAALGKLSASPARSAFVSDSVIDLQGAASVGMDTILIDRRGGRKDLPPRGTVLLADLRDLQKLLAGAE